MKLGCVYLCVADIHKSLDFYTKLLQQEPTYQNDNRWIQFDIGYNLALYNARYDEEVIHTSQMVSQHYNHQYQKDFNIPRHHFNNNIVLNFVVDDLNEEYERIKSLQIGVVSPLYYVHIANPYWYFTVIDPDGNECEITGTYHE